MRILYVNYGEQSGVTEAVCARLRAAGHEVLRFDPVEGFLYKRSLGRLRVPNVLPLPALATAAAMARFRANWKELYCHTRFAFDRLSDRCERGIERAAADAVLQAGCLFAPGRTRRRPYYLYVDHTRAISEAYAPIAGVTPPIPFEAGWRRREEQVYRRADRIFAMSEPVRRSLVGEYAVAPNRVVVVGAGPNVQPPPAAANEDRREAFLFVGKHFVPKGGPELVAAFASVRARHPGVELWIVGDPPAGPVPPGVRLLGRRGPEDLARLYARAFAFVLPTLREAFGLAFLEAMSFGLPCIGTRIEAIPEIVVDGETGLLVPVRDPPALAEAMLALLERPARARALGEAGRARVRRRFGWDRAVGRMLEVIERGAARPVGAR